MADGAEGGPWENVRSHWRAPASGIHVCIPCALGPGYGWGVRAFGREGAGIGLTLEPFPFPPEVSLPG